LLRETLGNIPVLYRAVNRLRGYRLHSPDLQIGYDLLGSWYGAWPLPAGVLSRSSVVYSFGVGEDISYDLEVIAKVGCDVYAFDPTPIARKWLANQTLPDRFIFREIGLAEFDGVADFYEPTGHSYPRSTSGVSITDRRYPVARLSTLMAANDHRTIDLLKMDIEGFEYAAIDEFIGAGIRPKFINVEFHHKSYGISIEQTRATVSRLRSVGYAIFWISDLGREYGFVRE
jgi:FkbM family methyltransferase